jgi:hypothetical protein
VSRLLRRRPGDRRREQRHAGTHETCRTQGRATGVGSSETTGRTRLAKHKAGRAALGAERRRGARALAEHKAGQPALGTANRRGRTRSCRTRCGGACTRPRPPRPPRARPPTRPARAPPPRSGAPARPRPRSVTSGRAAGLGGGASAEPRPAAAAWLFQTSSQLRQGGPACAGVAPPAIACSCRLSTADMTYGLPAPEHTRTRAAAARTAAPTGPSTALTPTDTRQACAGERLCLQHGSEQTPPYSCRLKGLGLRLGPAPAAPPPPRAARTARACSAGAPAGRSCPARRACARPRASRPPGGAGAR